MKRFIPLLLLLAAPAYSGGITHKITATAQASVDGSYSHAKRIGSTYSMSSSGVTAGTKDHTIVRKADVAMGNAGNWEASAGTSDDDSEWVVLDQNDWTYLGSHPHEFDSCASGVYDCAGVCDGDAVEDCAGECDGDALVDECGECGGNGSDII